MGSQATLDIGSLCIDYCKNSLNDHSSLFLTADLGTATYDYVDDVGEPMPESKEAYSQPLRNVLPRIELLGLTLETLRRNHEQTESSLPFEVLVGAFQLVDLIEGSRSRSVRNDLDQSFKDEVYSCLITEVGSERASEYHYSLWEVLEHLEPYAVLRLLAENPRNLDVPVIWRFADLVAGGWVAPAHVHRPLHTRDQYLIVTEGSTDAHILQKAFALRRPRIADFFYFVDMKENYPFSGTGNLFNFSKGLARIRIENRAKWSSCA